MTALANFAILLAALGVNAQECYAPSLPNILPAPTSGPHDAEWLTVIADSVDSTLFLAGVQENIVSSDLTENEVPVVGAYSISKGTYLWVNEFQDNATYQPKKAFALALSADETGLVVAGEVHGQNSWVFLHWLSAQSGAQLYGGLYVQTTFDWEIWSSQMLTFGDNDLIYLLLDNKEAQGNAAHSSSLIVVELAGSAL